MRGCGTEKRAIVSTEAVTGCCIVAGTAIARVQRLPLRVIENVEGFGAELDRARLALEREMLNQAHIEIGPGGIG